MRDILFRGKDVYTGKWLYGWYTKYCGGRWPLKDGIIPSQEAMDGCWREFEVLPDTVTQCTGLNDKNGNMIYDGDVLQFGAYQVMVFWNGEAFQWQARTGTECWRKCPEKDWNYIELAMIAAEIAVCGQMTTEIIGNIFDDPELYGKFVKTPAQEVDSQFAWDDVRKEGF